MQCWPFLWCSRKANETEALTHNTSDHQSQVTLAKRPAHPRTKRPNSVVLLLLPSKMGPRVHTAMAALQPAVRHTSIYLAQMPHLQNTLV